MITHPRQCEKCCGEADAKRGRCNQDKTKNQDTKITNRYIIKAKQKSKTRRSSIDNLVCCVHCLSSLFLQSIIFYQCFVFTAMPRQSIDLFMLLSTWLAQFNVQYHTAGLARDCRVGIRWHFRYGCPISKPRSVLDFSSKKSGVVFFSKSRKMSSYNQK